MSRERHDSITALDRAEHEAAQRHTQEAPGADRLGEWLHGVRWLSLSGIHFPPTHRTLADLRSDGDVVCAAFCACIAGLSVCSESDLSLLLASVPAALERARSLHPDHGATREFRWRAVRAEWLEWCEALATRSPDQEERVKAEAMDVIVTAWRLVTETPGGEP